MASFIFDSTKLKIAKGEINFMDDEKKFKIALVTSTLFNDTVTYSDATKWDDISSAVEISNDSSWSSVGYIPGGRNLTNINYIEREDGFGISTIKIQADDIDSWDGGVISTIDAQGAVVYDSTDSNALICAIDFGTKTSSSNGAMTVSLSGGWLQLK